MLLFLQIDKLFFFYTLFFVLIFELVKKEGKRLQKMFLLFLPLFSNLLSIFQEVFQWIESCGVKICFLQLEFAFQVLQTHSAWFFRKKAIIVHKLERKQSKKNLFHVLHFFFKILFPKLQLKPPDLIVNSHFHLPFWTGGKMNKWVKNKKRQKNEGDARLPRSGG